MDRGFSPDEVRIEAIKGELRARGWYLRYTEWPSGHQVVLHARADTARHLVTEWHETELAAWRAALRLAVAVEQQRPEPAAPLD